MRWPGRSKRSERVTEVVCAPGNGGMAQIARCVPVDLKDVDAMVRLAEAEQPGLTIVGPELPLSLGIVDALQERGLRVFGPTRAAAMLETSKGFAKRFLQRHNIPTANYAVCTSAAEVEKAIDIFHPPIVVKADGLAAGKGVIICDSRHTAVEAAQGLFTGTLLGAAEQQVVIEEFLEGDEISFLCLSDGKHVAPLVPAQDHKRIGEGDTGPNTGGMGVYSTDAHARARHDGVDSAPHRRAHRARHGRGRYALRRRALLRPDDDRARTRRCSSSTPASAIRKRRPSWCASRAIWSTPSKPASTARLAESRTALGSRSLSLRRRQLRRLSRQLQNRLPDHRPQRRRAGSRGAGLPLRHLAGGRPTASPPAAACSASPPPRDSLEEALARAYQAMAEIHFEGMYYRRDIGHRALKPKS